MLLTDDLISRKVFVGGLVMLTWLTFVWLDRGRQVSRRVLWSIPLGGFALLMAWTLAVQPFSRHGDHWPLAVPEALLPIVAAWHLALFGMREPFSGQRLDHAVLCLVFAVLHLFIFAPAWFFCLLAISKDYL